MAPDLHSNAGLVPANRVEHAGFSQALQHIFGKQSSWRLVVVASVVMTLTAVALGLMLMQVRRTTLAEAHRNIDVLALAITEQTSRSLQAGHVVLEDLQRTISGFGPETIASLKLQLAGEETFRFMKARANFLPQVDAFTIIAADGKLVNFSRQWPPPPTDLSDRDYLAFFRQNDTKQAFVSAPVRNRGTGVLTSYIVRRVNSRNGEFLGMVLAALNLDYFRDFFKAVTETAGARVTLLRQDGTVLTGYPESASAIVIPLASQWFRIVRDGRPAVFETEGGLNTAKRLVAVYPLKDYPMVVTVSLRKREVLAGWWVMVLITGCCFLVVSGCVAVLIAIQVRHDSKLRQSERELRSQARELTISRAEIEEHSTKLQAALRHMNQGILMVSAGGRVVVCNTKAADILDLPSDLLHRKPTFDELIDFQKTNGEFTGYSHHPGMSNLQESLTGPLKYERTRPNGMIIEVQTVLVPSGGLVRTYTDITDQRRAQHQVQFLADHDPLTGLSNRNAFRQKLNDLLEARGVSQNGFVIYYLDLDRFKAVNDRYGHSAGDRLLVTVSKRLRGAVREGDFVARMGGDEFCIVQLRAAGSREVADLAGRLLTAMAEPFQIDDVRCPIGASIGVARFPDHGTDAETLLKHADIALYLAKSDGRGIFRVFDPSISRELDREALMRQDLSSAMAQNELHLEYQPIVDALTLDAVRFEALLRWTHPTLGPISPTIFIPIAEQTGLIVAIGLWALETACKEASDWPGVAAVSVNLSPIQFAGSDLPSQVEQILQKTGLPPRRLHFEVTEGVLLENTVLVMDTMKRLRALGVGFSLDDFGTAHAGLTYLRRFPFDVLKIDKSFVQGAASNGEARVLLSAIQGLAAACKLQVVAEGVETEDDLQVVRSLGCDHVQGYFTGRPARAPFERANATYDNGQVAEQKLTLVGS